MWRRSQWEEGQGGRGGSFTGVAANPTGFILATPLPETQEKHDQEIDNGAKIQTSLKPTTAMDRGLFLPDAEIYSKQLTSLPGSLQCFWFCLWSFCMFKNLFICFHLCPYLKCPDAKPSFTPSSDFRLWSISKRRLQASKIPGLVSHQSNFLPSLTPPRSSLSSFLLKFNDVIYAKNPALSNFADFPLTTTRLPMFDFPSASTFVPAWESTHQHILN